MSDDSLIREVEEEVRREQIKRLWDRYGVYVLGACVAVVLIVAGIKGWQYWQHHRALGVGEQYMAALDLAEEGKAAEAQAAFAALARDAGGGASTLARLHEAAAALAAGDRQAAIETYDAVARDSGASPVLRDLARVRAGLLLVDSASVAELTERVGALGEAGSPWRNSAREILALGSYRAGDLATADRLFNEILSDPQAPLGLRQRAQIMIALMTPQLGKAAPAGDEEEASAQ